MESLDQIMPLVRDGGGLVIAAIVLFRLNDTVKALVSEVRSLREVVALSLGVAAAPTPPTQLHTNGTTPASSTADARGAH